MNFSFRFTNQVQLSSHLTYFLLSYFHFHFICFFRSYTSWNFVGTGKGLVLLKQYFQNACSIVTSACCGRSISVRLPCRGRAERSHRLRIACCLRTCRTLAYAENFWACIKLLGVLSELRRTSAYDNVLWTLAQLSPDVHQLTTAYGKKASYAGVRRAHTLYCDGHSRSDILRATWCKLNIPR